MRFFLLLTVGVCFGERKELGWGERGNGDGDGADDCIDGGL